MRQRIGSAFLGASALAALSAWCAILPPAGIARSITASPDEEPAFSLNAKGTQTFECKPLASDPSRFAWNMTVPEATLYDGASVVGRLVSGPTWESNADRSSVTAIPRAAQDGGANNLPWLLLRTATATDTGLFNGVNAIQRVNTVGGVAPATGCDASHVGTEARVAFSADFYFYRRRG